MAFLELHYYSPSIGKQHAADVILPEGKTGPFPVFYLLHGLSDDHTIWQRRTSIERYVEDLPLIVVMPDSGRGFYTDAEVGPNHESAIIKDLIPYIDTMFNTKAERGGRVVGGLSMGGYGAMKLALKYPELFCSANSHSGAVAWAGRAFGGDDDWAKEFSLIVGKNPQGGSNDCFALADKIDRKLLPALRIDCGTEDFLIEENRAFTAHLKKIGIPHEYEEFPGSHTWAYWDVHVQEAIAFHRKSLDI